MPAWALCKIGENICTIPSENSVNFPSIQNTNNEFGINTGHSELNNPAQNTMQSDMQKQNLNGIQMQGSLGCQFGNCKKKQETDFMQNQ
jgi:hypothetical protein